MADGEDDTLDLTEVLTDIVTTDLTADQAADESVEIEIEGEEIAPEDDLVKHLRAQNRDQAARIAKLERPAQAIEVGKKPDLWEDCEGDPDKFEAELLAWNQRKQASEQHGNAQQEQATTRNRQFELAQINYKAKAQTLGVKDFDKAEQSVLESLGKEYLGFILQYAEKPVELVAALGKHPALLAKIADEPDPMRRLVMLTKMEAKVTIKRKGPPPPEAETIQRGSAPLAAVSADKKADALLKKAGETGNIDEYRAYMRSKKKA